MGDRPTEKASTYTGEHNMQLKVIENRVLRRVFGPKRDDIIGLGENCIVRNFINLYSWPNIIRTIKSRKIRWAGHIACMREEACRVLVGVPEG
jgi:hypothetical protein